MKLKLKPVAEQVIVITGADSGIGLATARAAADKGAHLMLNSRSEEALASVAAALRGRGAKVEWYAGDVADPQAMHALAGAAVQAFGRIDTWVNNAGVSIYGEIERVPLEDAQRLFATNYWGVVNGSLAAIPHLRENGGALINVGSVLSDRAIPLQGHYSASKHAVKGFTDALRMELARAGAPVAVTLVKPSAIDTPYPEHAANYMDNEPKHVAPVYAPQVVAQAILECASHATASLTVGGGGRATAMVGVLAPRVADRQMEATMFDAQQKEGEPNRHRRSTLYSPPRHTGRVHGSHDGHVATSSVYTRAAEHPLRSAMVVGLLGAGAAWLVRSGVLDRVEGDIRARLGRPATVGGDSTLTRADRDMRHVLEHLQALGPKPLDTLTAEEARRQPTPAEAVGALLRKHGKSAEPEAVGRVVDRTIPGPAGEIPIRVYAPEGTGPFPVIVYTHGGGWVIATMDTYDSSARALANAAGAVVVSVEYRKGPEHRFPAAHEDAFAAYLWTLQNAASVGGDPARVAVAGESAGGNLAVSIAMMARDQRARPPVHVVAVYPIADGDTVSPSYRENADAVPLNRPMMKWFFQNYLRSPADSDHPLISLVRADLSGLPPTTIITAEIDPLRSDGEELAARMHEAGVTVAYHEHEGVTHEFFGMGAVVAKAKVANEQAAEALRAAFERAPSYTLG